MNYLFIQEDGQAHQTDGEELTQEDMQSINEGYIDIIRFRGNQFERAKINVDPPSEQEGQFSVTWERV